MGAFTVNSRGYSMYTPSWQRDPGSTMRQMNKQAAASHDATIAALGNNLIAGIGNAAAGSVQLTMQIATERMQKTYNAKLSAAYSSLDTMA